jgi:hypothetical protein
LELQIPPPNCWQQCKNAFAVKDVPVMTPAGFVLPDEKFLSRTTHPPPPSPESKFEARTVVIWQNDKFLRFPANFSLRFNCSIRVSKLDLCLPDEGV